MSVLLEDHLQSSDPVLPPPPLAVLVDKWGMCTAQAEAYLLGRMLRERRRVSRVLLQQLAVAKSEGSGQEEEEEHRYGGQEAKTQRALLKLLLRRSCQVKELVAALASRGTLISRGSVSSALAGLEQHRLARAGKILSRGRWTYRWRLTPRGTKAAERLVARHDERAKARQHAPAYADQPVAA